MQTMHQVAHSRFVGGVAQVLSECIVSARSRLLIHAAIRGSTRRAVTRSELTANRQPLLRNLNPRNRDPREESEHAE